MDIYGLLLFELHYHGNNSVYEGNKPHLLIPSPKLNFVRPPVELIQSHGPVLFKLHVGNTRLKAQKKQIRRSGRSIKKRKAGLSTLTSLWRMISFLSSREVICCRSIRSGDDAGTSRHVLQSSSPARILRIRSAKSATWILWSSGVQLRTQIGAIGRRPSKLSG